MKIAWGLSSGSIRIQSGPSKSIGRECRESESEALKHTIDEEPGEQGGAVKRAFCGVPRSIFRSGSRLVSYPSRSWAARGDGLGDYVPATDVGNLEQVSRSQLSSTQAFITDI